jgi:succinate dehydrogenase / fumarate reductase membrane anchor subunit
MQRVTAVALIPLSLWIAASLFVHAQSDFATIIQWLRMPWSTGAIVFLLIALFYHMALGLQVVVEDYVHTERTKNLAIVVIRLSCFTFAAAGIVSAIYIAFG